MKELKIYLLLIVILSLLGCKEQALVVDEPKPNLDGILKQMEGLEIYDQTKVAVAYALDETFIQNESLSKDLKLMLIENEKASEFLYIKHKELQLSNGKTLEESLLEKVEGDSKLTDLIKSIEQTIPNLVIKIPDWANAIFPEIDFQNIDFFVQAGVRQQQTLDNVNFRIDNSNTPYKQVPIQVKESEKLIPLINGSSTTLWNDQIEDHLPPLRTCPVELESYSVYQNEEYYFIDKIALNSDLVHGRICGISIDPVDDGNSTQCQQVSGRDCVAEKNVIEGFKLANNSVFLGINNQPGGEDVISLHFVFVASQMCGDLTVPLDCPPTSWKFVFFGTFNDFYEIQYHRGSPLSHEMSDVIFVGIGYYLKSFPKYYDIPVDHSFENIYSQAPYLINTANSTWDGNIYGSVVSFSVYEHDDVIVKETNTQSVTVTNTTKVSAKLSIGDEFETGGDFSNSVTRTSSYTYTIEAEKDVELGQNASVYFDANYQSDGFYGINKSTGSIITHFAYYD